MTAVETSLVEGVLTVTLARPERMNAINDDMLDGLAAVAIRAQDEAVRVIVLRGQGRAFCAGADLGVQADVDGPPGPSEATLIRSDEVFSAWEAIPVPVIAAVHGAAMAGGLELLLCCDLVVASNAAVFADAHARFGLLPGAGGSYRLPRRIGASAARLLLYTGDEIDAGEAFRIGLVDMLVVDDQLSKRVDELARMIAQRSPLALREMKRLVALAADVAPEAGLRAAHQAIVRHRASADFAEGLHAFLERRTPRFVGR